MLGGLGGNFDQGSSVGGLARNLPPLPSPFDPQRQPPKSDQYHYCRHPIERTA